MWYVYALRENDTGRIYIGMTNDLKRRLTEHSSGKTKAVAHFKKVEIVYYEWSKNKRDAVKREKQLKTGFGRGYLKRRIENDIITSS